MPDPTDVEVTMLLCDAAQSVGGKLYILGAGWTRLVAGGPVPHALAVRVAVPWDQANTRIPVRAYLVNSDGGEVDFGMGPVQFVTEIEVGRPPGLEPGTPLDAVLAMTSGPLPLEPGGYVWQLDVAGQTKARAPFRVVPPQ